MGSISSQSNSFNNLGIEPHDTKYVLNMKALCVVAYNFFFLYDLFLALSPIYMQANSNLLTTDRKLL